MAGLRRTGCILVIALIPGMLTGCASTSSYLSKFRKPAESPDELWARAQQHERDQQYPEAQQLYAELYHRDPQSARYVHRFAVVCMMRGDHVRAHSSFKRALALEPDNPELLADMGYSAYLQQQYAEAEELLTASLRHAGNNPRAKSNLALAIGCQGRYDESLALFREVHGQDEAEVLCNLAYVKSQRGDVAEARKLYKQVLALDPSMKKASAALAQLKSSSPGAPSVADGKPYRKYMNRPAVTQKKPMDEAPETVAQAPIDEESFSKPLAVTPVANSAEEAPSEDLPPADGSGWSTAEAETKSPSSPQTPREFPLEDKVVEPAAASAPTEKVLHDLKEPQTVTTEDEPFSVVEETPVVTAPAELDENPVEASPSPDEPIHPAWLEDREKLISSRSGQSGFMNFCPVALRDKLQLVDASPEYSADYQSQRLQFSSDEAQKKFLANPERYLPAAGGLDVVAVSQGTAVAQGSLEHALWFHHKLYLFLNRENLETFRTQAREFAVQQ